MILTKTHFPFLKGLQQPYREKMVDYGHTEKLKRQTMWITMALLHHQSYKDRQSDHMQYEEHMQETKKEKKKRAVPLGADLKRDCTFRRYIYGYKLSQA